MVHLGIALCLDINRHQAMREPRDTPSHSQDFLNEPLSPFHRLYQLPQLNALRQRLVRDHQDGEAIVPLAPRCRPCLRLFLHEIIAENCANNL